MNDNYSTERLFIQKLTLNDVEFVIELVNSPEWLQFIGDRNIHTIAEAGTYIQNIIDNPTIDYWVVKLNDEKIPIGIISFIKRNYLSHHDIGFAFLDEHKKKGYGFEAASVVLDDALQNSNHTQVLATTIKENSKSIQLLQKLGFSFDKEIIHEDEPLFVFVKTGRL